MADLGVLFQGVEEPAEDQKIAKISLQSQCSEVPTHLKTVVEDCNLILALLSTLLFVQSRGRKYENCCGIRED